MQDVKLEFENTEAAFKQIFNKLEEMERRQKKMESQLTKVINLQTNGDSIEEEQLMTDLAQMVSGSKKGIKTRQVMSLFECSKPTALNKMKKLADDSKRIAYVKGEGRKSDRLKHKRFSIGNMY